MENSTNNIFLNGLYGFRPAMAIGMADDLNVMEHLLICLGKIDVFASGWQCNILKQISVWPLTVILREVNRRVQDYRADNQYLMACLTVQKNLVQVLGEIGDPIAIESLIATLNLKFSPWVNPPKVFNALLKIGEQAVVPLIGILNGNYSTGFKRSAVEVLGEIGDARAVGALGMLLNGGVVELCKTSKIALQKIDRLQKTTLGAYLNPYCKRCHLRPGEGKVKIGPIKSMTYWTCRGCESSLHLIKGVSQVIGLIGGDLTDYKVEDDKVFVNLWSESEKKARNADIDKLEIRSSREITYDYALTAVLTTLKDDVSRPREYLKKTLVVLKGNPPVLGSSKRILEQEFGNVLNLD